MAEKTQRPGKVAVILNVSGMTLRNYIREFDQFLSPQAISKTGRRFTDRDVRTLQLATSILREGYTYDQVREQLANRPVENKAIDDLPPYEESLTDDPPSSTLQVYEQFFKPVIAAKNETIQAKEEHIEELQKEVKWLQLPWYKKFFRDPPE
ncbi:MAG: MerR family transcriptional regulator [Anaerolineales bacterium]